MLILKSTNTRRALLCNNINKTGLLCQENSTNVEEQWRQLILIPFIFEKKKIIFFTSRADPESSNFNKTFSVLLHCVKQSGRPRGFSLAFRPNDWFCEYGSVKKDCYATSKKSVLQFPADRLTLAHCWQRRSPVEGSFQSHHQLERGILHLLFNLYLSWRSQSHSCRMLDSSDGDPFNPSICYEHPS